MRNRVTKTLLNSIPHNIEIVFIHLRNNEQSFTSSVSSLILV